MQVQTVSYMKRKNMGNYEHEEVSITALVEDGDNHMEVLAQAKLACHQALSMVITQSAPPVPAQEEKKEDEPKKTAKVAKKTTKKKAASKPKDEVPEPAVEEPSEEPAQESFTLQDVKQILAQVWKSKGENVAKDILKDFGVARSNELSEEQYAAVVKEAQKCLK